MPVNQKNMVIASLFAVLVIISLLASACLSTQAPQHTQTVIPPPVTPPVRPSVSPAGTLLAANDSTVRVIIPPPAVICNCPMEPAVSPTSIPAKLPDTGVCHCP